MADNDIRNLITSTINQYLTPQRRFDAGRLPPPTPQCKSMRWPATGQKIPSFRAVLPVAGKPQRLPETLKSVSDRLLSLFT